MLDQAVEDFVAGQAEDVIDPVGLAKRNHLRAAVVTVAVVRTDKVLAAFASGLSTATATDFVDEDAQRDVFAQMLDHVLLKGQSPLDSVREAAAAEQRIIDAYYAR